MNNIFFKHITLLSLLGIFIFCCVFFLGKFQHYIHPKRSYASLGRYSNSHHEKMPHHIQGRQVIFFSLNNNDFDHQNIRSILHRLMDQHFHVRGNTLPINQESIDWMSRLPLDHAISMIQILSHTAPVDWQEQVVSLRNLPEYEQKRALKTNRFNNTSYECLDPTECHR